MATARDARRRTPIHWVGSSLKDLSAFPDEVKQDIGYALHQAQSGQKSPASKPLAEADHVRRAKERSDAKK